MVLVAFQWLRIFLGHGEWNWNGTDTSFFTKNGLGRIFTKLAFDQ